MLFNSHEYIFLFLPLTFFVYFYLNKKRLTNVGNGVLVFSSLFFYSWWNISYLPLILSSMLFNFMVGSTLAKNKQRSFSNKAILTFGIISNIALLGYFKYSDFFIENYNLVIGSNVKLLHLALPLAISFFTFQQIAYLIDSYKLKTDEYDFLNYAVFVTFFPQLIAGPIVHHSEMMPQVAAVRNKIINYKNVSFGIFVFSIGLFKKVVLADSFAVWATAGYDTSLTLSFIEAWITSLSYTFQLYFDFSGYTDMAVGSALLFNIRLPINFNSPYKATSIQDFWRRWHITLSRFLRDYVYIPLGGNRVVGFRTYNNLVVTFIIGGVWHGAGWTFIFWGMLHGVALSVNRLWSRLGLKLWGWLAWLVTFNFVNLTWVFFRAENWDDATKVLYGMFRIDNFVISWKFYSGSMNTVVKYWNQLGLFEMKWSSWMPSVGMHTCILILFGFILVLLMKNTSELIDRYRNSYKKVWVSMFAGFLIFISIKIMAVSVNSEFLYFNF